MACHVTSSGSGPWHRRPPVAGLIDTAAVVAEREAAVRRVDQTFARLAETLTPLRAEWFESVGGQTYLGVEVKSSLGADSGTVLTVSFGGQSVTMNRFVDAGQYIYHTFNEPVAVDDIPAEVTIASTGGGSITVPVVEWLGDPRPDPGPHYATGFVYHYMDPTELDDRIEALAAEFPELAEIIELPYQTNGYRRKAQAMIGAGATAFYVTSHAWGHEGGNDLRLETVHPGTANSPLTVGVTGGTHILSAVQDWRGTAVWPGRTGPVIDVLYSAAGNSADEHWYNRGIFGWDFEVGAHHARAHRRRRHVRVDRAGDYPLHA